MYSEKRLNSVVSFRTQLNRLDRVTNCYTGDAQLIHDATTAKQVLSSLKYYSDLALDCEGVRLGREGKLTLIQIGKSIAPFICLMYWHLVDSFSRLE